MRRLLFIIGLLFCAVGASAQTTTFNGVIKDLTSTPVPTGQVTFQLKPGIDTTISGSSRFVPATIFCEIHNPGVVSTSGTGTITVVVDTAQNWLVGDSLIFVGTPDATLNASSVASPYIITSRNSSTSFVFTQSGAHTNGAGGTVGGLYKSGGTGACAVMQNTAITPANTSYTVAIQAVFSPSSAFNTYAIGSGPVDISTVVPTPSQMPAYSFADTFSNQAIGGNKSFTGNNPFTGSNTISNLNSVRYVDGVKFTTIAAAIADLPANGGIVVTPPGYAETISSQLLTGSNTKLVQLQLGSDNVLTASVTGGVCAIPVASGSSISGPPGSVGANGSFRGGAMITLANSASVSALICNAAQDGTQEYFGLSNVFVHGNPSATVSTALVNLGSIFVPSKFADVIIDNQSNAALLQLSNGPVSGGFGPVNFPNIWLNCISQTGCKPLVVKALNASAAVQQVNFYGGALEHAGSGNYEATVDGSVGVDSVLGVNFHDTYCEHSQLTLGCFSLKDVRDFSISNTIAFNTAGLSTGDLINISQSVANRVGPGLITNVRDSGGGFTNLLNDTVRSSVVASAANSGQLLFYDYANPGFTVAPAFMNTPFCAVGDIAAGGFCIGSVAGYIQIDTKGTAGSEFRTLNAAGNFTGLTTSTVRYPEAGAPSAAASSDVCYGDSTAHALRCSFNNSAFGPLVTAAPCTTSQKAESAADTNVLTCTPVAQAGSYRIRLILSVSAANAATLGWTATWTDSNGNAQTPTNLSLSQSGAAAPALTFTTSAAGNYYGYADIDVNNAGTSIVIKLTFSGTSFAGKATATVERLI